MKMIQQYYLGKLMRGEGEGWRTGGTQIELRRTLRTAGRSVDPRLKSFGSWTSALIDVDNNNYTDLLTGALKMIQQYCIYKLHRE